MAMTLLVAASLCASAADLTPAAQAVFARAQKTVVTVRLVVKMSMGGHDREQKIEVIGTVIDPSGLTVLPAAAADPGSFLRAMAQGRGAADRFESTVTETTLILADGTELEADLILKDAELDFAFLRPREPPKGGVDAVALKPGRALPAPLEDLILVGRYGRSVNRAPWVAITQVRAVVRGPRTYAVCGAEADVTGTVAYAADGTPAGIFVTRLNRETMEGSRSGMPGVPSGHSGVVILRPIADLMEAAEQARKTKKPVAEGKDAGQ